MIDIDLIVKFHENTVYQLHNGVPNISIDGFMKYVYANHKFNYELWHEEDKARREDMGAEYVYNAKRAIDKLNQSRNNCVEEMDKLLVEMYKPKKCCVPFSTETPGMAIDRMSILSLKIYHMKEQVDRKDNTLEHRRECENKLSVLKRQLIDLSCALEHLLEEVIARTRSFRVYYQFKMYNDPQLNPQLYGKQNEN